MLKKIITIFLCLLFFLAVARPTNAQEERSPIYFFWSKSCPHCAREKVFLQKLAEKYENLEIKSFEISTHPENLALLKKVGEKFSARGGVPFTAVGEYHFVGYLDDETTGKQIEEAVQCYLAKGCEDIVKELITPPATKDHFQAIPETLNLPLIGEIKTKNFSLPALTFIIALLDGFNPCAMWVLLFLISLLLGMKDRKRMWILGTVFITASGLVYFLFLSAWLNLFLFLGFVFWVRILIGLIALSTGSYNLYDFLTNPEGACKVTGNQKRQRVFEKLKTITQKKQFLLALGGIILLAFAVNLVELVCSAGLPAIYTQILSLTQLPQWQYYLYLVFYIFIFMLDDLLVFFIAMTTLRVTGIQGKYARFSHLIGGTLMIIIGLLLLFKPEWLMFG